MQTMRCIALCSLVLCSGAVWAEQGPQPVPALAAPATPAAAQWVGRFDSSLGQWRPVQLKADIPSNQFQFRHWDGVNALEVRSSASMSLMAKPLSVDLEATPVLCWRWRVDAPLTTADMRQKKGDDYAARVYLSLKLPEAAMGFGVRSKLGLARAIWGKDVPDAAINYVWDNRQPKGTALPNAYTDRVMMVVVRTGAEDAGAWVVERRNLQDDVSRWFSPQAQAVQLAVTADTDNTGEVAHAGFADFHLVPAASACQFPS